MSELNDEVMIGCGISMIFVFLWINSVEEGGVRNLYLSIIFLTQGCTVKKGRRCLPRINTSRLMSDCVKYEDDM